jgi:hypothetical protein
MIDKVHNRFEKFILKLFPENYYQYQSREMNSDKVIDLIFNKGDKKLFVELKVFRSKSSPPLINALQQLRFYLANPEENNGILIITSIIDPSIAAELSKQFGVAIWDRSVLFKLTNSNYELRKELESILSELKQSADEDVFDGIFEIQSFDIRNIWNSNPATAPRQGPVKKGHDLCNELRAIPAGKADSTSFEKKCTEVVKYLFDIDLSNWAVQNPTNDTLHKFDLIARIVSQNDFWKFIARDFKTRYAIFEFKNYINNITQAEVYTTEKYLYTTALRTFAIIVTRVGAEKNAITAMKGSLREHGKLIICLNIDDVCKMLHMKDRGDDPNTFLSEHIDDLLMKLSR